MELEQRLNNVYRDINKLKNERDNLTKDTAKNYFLEKVEEFRRMREKLVNDVRVQFPSLVMPLMNQSERIENISWDQYTDYFNDGDECTFSTYYRYLRVNGDDYDDRKELTPEDINIVKNIMETMKVIPDDIYKEVFGDHATILISKDGTLTVSQCEHE